ncbi:uncharacterized protein ALTATR162_LOCUS5648 [Alternaria atra]|uniref:Uncharacterized protein n=1 Tax=Alternaria atra TaxID=119953 RepID=A0A8J2IAF2_9PLEO|nr:uncharacterized protein ALTATR162_LOCUS5648 [Alternaria atra]CAG5159662.1 unnamed protein product [Alternaria atra]
MAHTLVEPEQNAKNGVLEPLPKDRNTVLRPEENPNGSLPTSPIPPESSHDVRFPSPTLCKPIRSPQVAPTSIPATLTSDAEFRIIEAELTNCEMTREALARREAVLQERKAEIVRENKMRLDKEVRDLAMGDEEEDMNEGLYMREVQRRIEAKLQRADGNTNEAMEKKVQQVEEVKEAKVVPVSAPERRRLAHLTLLKNDPRLG